MTDQENITTAIVALGGVKVLADSYCFVNRIPSGFRDYELMEMRVPWNCFSWVAVYKSKSERRAVRFRSVDPEQGGWQGGWSPAVIVWGSKENPEYEAAIMPSVHSRWRMDVGAAKFKVGRNFALSPLSSQARGQGKGSLDNQAELDVLATVAGMAREFGDSMFPWSHVTELRDLLNTLRLGPR